MGGACRYAIVVLQFLQEAVRQVNSLCWLRSRKGLADNDSDVAGKDIRTVSVGHVHEGWLQFSLTVQAVPKQIRS